MWQKLLKIFAAKNSNNAASIFESYKKKIIMGAIFSALPTICVIFVLIIVIFGPVMMAQQYIDDTKNEVAIFFEKVGNVLTLKGWCSESDGTCQRKAEQKYYEQLNDVYNEYKDKGVEIDVQLITATILYGKVFSEDITYLDDIDSDTNSLTEGFEDIKLGDIKKLASKMVSGSRINYDNYRKYLEETYVEKRFSDLYKNEEQKTQIIDHIMSFASLKTKPEGNFASCKVINSSCSGITIDSGPYAGTYTLEEYIAGVVSNEVGSGWPDEAIKAQAIAARSFALNYTNNCQTSIANSTGAQTFVPATDQRIIDLVNSTSGMVMTYEDDIINAQYASWWGNNSGSSCDDYINCQNGECSIVLYKAPNHEKWTFTMPQNYFAWSSVTDNIQMSDGEIYSLGGHCRGMSQFGSKYLDLGLNYDYQKILSTFYSDGVQLSSFGKSSNSCPQGVSTQGLIASNYSGFLQRVSSPTDSDYYYSQDYFYSSNVGQCVWYAKRRSLEIINTIEIDEAKRVKAEAALKDVSGNGRDWWDNPNLQMFGSSTDYTKPKPGALIVWRYTSGNIANMGADYGHIAVVEDVDYEKGLVTVSDGWKNNWENPNSIAYASFGFRTVPFEWVLDYGQPSKYIFMGYVYLLD